MGEPKGNIDELRALEHPTLKVPYETLNKKFRIAQKNIDREVSHVQSVTGDLEKVLLQRYVGASLPAQFCVENFV